MSSGRTERIFPTNISKKQAADTGMAMLLILLLAGLVLKNDLYYKIAVLALLVNMTVPMLYYPFAVVWLGFSNILGTVSSKILLSVVYAVMVVPLGRYRRLIGKDSLQLNGFKKGTASVMRTRNHEFTSSDIENPY